MGNNQQKSRNRQTRANSGATGQFRPLPEAQAQQGSGGDVRQQGQANARSQRSAMASSQGQVQQRPPPYHNPRNQSNHLSQAQAQYFFQQPQHQPNPQHMPQQMPQQTPQQSNTSSTTAVSQTQQYQIQFHINKETLEARRCSTQGFTHSLTFVYDSHVRCVANVYFFGIENLHAQTSTTMQQVLIRITPNSHIPHGIQRFALDAGSKMTFEQPCNFSLQWAQEKSWKKEADQIFPIIIEMYGYEYGDKAIERTYATVHPKSSGEVDIRTVTQKLNIFGRSYELHVIYGDFNKGVTVQQESECVICYDAVPTIAIVPCSHVCLCAECHQQALKSSIKECPVCRNPIKKYLSMA